MLNGAELVERGEEQWDSARAAWNLAIDQQPAVVARPRNADEVAGALRYARERGLRVALQPRDTARARWLGWARRHSCSRRRA